MNILFQMETAKAREVKSITKTIIQGKPALLFIGLNDNGGYMSYDSVEKRDEIYEAIKTKESWSHVEFLD